MPFSLEYYLKKLSDHPRLVLAVFALLLIVQVNAYWIPVPDGVSYLSIARSIGTGKGFLVFTDPHIYHTSGYSLAISPAFILSEDRPFLLISAIHWAFLIVFMICIYKWMQITVGSNAILLTLITVSNVGILYYFRRTLSEAAFIPVMVAAALALNRAVQNRNNRTRYLVLGTILTCCLCLIRQVGISIAAGFIVLLALKLRSNSIRIKPAIVLAAVLTISVVACLAVEITYGQHTARMNDAPTYVSHIIKTNIGLGPQLLEGLRLRIQEWGRLLIPAMFKAYGGWLCSPMLLYLPLSVILIAGWWQFLSRRANVLFCALPFYVLIYVVWPYDQGTRFMTPIVPVLWVSVWTFVEHGRFRPYARRLFAVLLLLGGLTSAVYWTIDFTNAKRWNSQWPTVERIAAVIDDKQGHIACYGVPRPIHLMLSMSMDKPPRAFSMDEDKTQDADYIITSSQLATISGFKRIADTGGFVVYQRLSDTTSMPHSSDPPR